MTLAVHVYVVKLVAVTGLMTSVELWLSTGDALPARVHVYVAPGLESTWHVSDALTASMSQLLSAGCVLNRGPSVFTHTHIITWHCQMMLHSWPDTTPYNWVQAIYWSVDLQWNHRACRVHLTVITVNYIITNCETPTPLKCAACEIHCIPLIQSVTCSSQLLVAKCH